MLLAVVDGHVVALVQLKVTGLIYALSVEMNWGRTVELKQQQQQQQTISEST